MPHRIIDSARTPSSDSVATGPLLLWLIPQLIAIVIATSRVALWARYPQPGELMSLRLLLSVQLVTASLLFPILLRDRASAVAVIASAWPIALIAGSISATPISLTLGSELFVAGFLIALVCWSPKVRCSVTARIAVALAALWTLGGPLIVYLRVEFADSASPIQIWMAGPIVAVQRYLSGERGLFACSACLVGVALGGLLCQLLDSRRSALKRPPA